MILKRTDKLFFLSIRDISSWWSAGIITSRLWCSRTAQTASFTRRWHERWQVMPRPVSRTVVTSAPGRMAKTLKIPEAPDEETRNRYNVTHMPYAAWCEICVKSRAKDDPHRKKAFHHDEVDPEISMDYFSLGLERNLQLT